VRLIALHESKATKG